MEANGWEWLLAMVVGVGDRIVESGMNQAPAANVEHPKRVYYLSLEFLLGRQLFAALANFELVEPMRAALADLGVDLDHLRTVEPDAALGNGGLGRLAACFMESMATLSIAAFGYGIRYDHGLFRQTVEDGWQHEYPEDWLESGNPWEFERAEVAVEIGFGGRVEVSHREDG